MAHSFETIEGQYVLSSCPLPPYKELQGNSVPVSLSFIDNFLPCESNLDGIADCAYSSCEWNSPGIFCINIGKEIYIYSQDNQHIPIDRRIFKTLPTCHSFKTGASDAPLLVGLSSGEIHLIYPTRKDTCKTFNEERTIDKTSVTCVTWVPESPNQFLVSHTSGNLYLYDEKLAPVATIPTYEIFKGGLGFSVYTCKAKSTRNPLYKWSFGARTGSFGSLLSVQSENGTKSAPNYLENGFHPKALAEDAKGDTLCNLRTSFLQTYQDSVGVNQFAFSPCSNFLAVVTQDGHLMVVEYHTMELFGYMRSYFAGLLCVDWSPDSRFIAVGGQDDLITVWSMEERAVICRGEGHRSWISTVRFDPFMCPSRHISPVNLISEHDQHLHDRQASDSSRGRYDEPCNMNGSSSSLQSQTHPAITLARTYRLGSVGQDTMFCLWELTEDVIRQGVMFVRESAPSLTLDDPVHFTDSESINPQSSTSTDAAVPNISLSSGRHSLRMVSSTGPSKGSMKRPTFGTNSPAQGRHMTNLFGFLTLSKRKGHNYSCSTVAQNFRHPSPPVLYGSERIKNPHSVFSRFTLHPSTRGATNSSQSSACPSSTLANGDASHPSTLNNITDANRFFDINDPNLFGSPMCPRLGDVPVLEPIVCTLMHQYRLSDLVFRLNTVHVVCQQGLIRTWSRPVKSGEVACLDERDVNATTHRKVSSGTEGVPSRQYPTKQGFGEREGGIFSPTPGCYQSSGFVQSGSDPSTLVRDPTFAEAPFSMTEKNSSIDPLFDIPNTSGPYSRISRTSPPAAPNTEATASRWSSAADSAFRTNNPLSTNGFYRKMDPLKNSTDL